MRCTNENQYRNIGYTSCIEPMRAYALTYLIVWIGHSLSQVVCPYWNAAQLSRSKTSYIHITQRSSGWLLGCFKVICLPSSRSISLKNTIQLLLTIPFKTQKFKNGSFKFFQMYPTEKKIQYLFVYSLTHFFILN